MCKRRTPIGPGSPGGSPPPLVSPEGRSGVVDSGPWRVVAATAPPHPVTPAQRLPWPGFRRISRFVRFVLGSAFSLGRLCGAGSCGCLFRWPFRTRATSGGSRDARRGGPTLRRVCREEASHERRGNCSADAGGFGCRRAIPPPGEGRTRRLRGNSGGGWIAIAASCHLSYFI